MVRERGLTCQISRTYHGIVGFVERIQTYKIDIYNFLSSYYQFYFKHYFEFAIYCSYQQCRFNTYRKHLLCIFLDTLLVCMHWLPRSYPNYVCRKKTSFGLNIWFISALPSYTHTPTHTNNTQFIYTSKRSWIKPLIVQ